ncbi:hypothetical protein [Pedococcus soli]
MTPATGPNHHHHQDGRKQEQAAGPTRSSCCCAPPGLEPLASADAADLAAPLHDLIHALLAERS